MLIPNLDMSVNNSEVLLGHIKKSEHSLEKCYYKGFQRGNWYFDVYLMIPENTVLSYQNSFAVDLIKVSDTNKYI